jgi:amino acid transporter
MFVIALVVVGQVLAARRRRASCRDAHMDNGGAGSTLHRTDGQTPGGSMSADTSPGAAFGQAPGDKGLKGGAIGLISSVVIGLASTAPAYSLAASLGLIVVLAGVSAPSIMLLAFIPMYLIAVAYRELNEAEPDCGTTFTWAGRAFGPWMGWMGGWGIIAADVIVMANLAQIAGAYTFQLFGAADLAGDTFWTTVAGVVWILVMTYICYRGIEVSARLQYALLGIELVVLAAFAVIALVKVYAGDAPEGSITPSLAWLWPTDMGITDFVDAILIAVFLYWGWDTAVACNEESDDPGKTPGRAAVLSTLLLVVTYVLVAVATVAFAGTGTEGIGLGNPDNSDDVFAAIGPSVFGEGGFGQFFVILLIISVLTSSAASTQTTILPTARAALSMGAYRAVPERFATIHPRYLTPSVATWGMGIVSIAFYVGLTLISTNVLADSIAAVGLLIAFYYGLTGFACVWYYRKHLRGRNLWTKGVLPGLGALMLLGAFVQASIGYANPEGGETTVAGIGGVFVIGIGALALGAVLMLVYSRIAPPFFRGETLVPGSFDLVLPPAGAGPTLGLPDSHERTVIAPDRSNLPPGQEPLDPPR